MLNPRTGVGELGFDNALRTCSTTILLYWFVFSFAHRLEAKLEDLAPAEDEPEPKPKSKPIDLIEMERGELPSFMKPTARLVGYIAYFLHHLFRFICPMFRD